MGTEKALETLENVRESISSYLSEGVKNRHSDFRTFTFCTSGASPAGRTVVLRGYNPERGTITLHSNYYAEKIDQLKISSDVCCVFYSKSKKIQIRCFGDALINHKNERSNGVWMNMSDMSKECYFQEPNPGSSIVNYNAFSKNIKNDESDAFTVIDVEVRKFDWLFLKREGHRRALIFTHNSESDTWISP